MLVDHGFPVRIVVEPLDAFPARQPFEGFYTGARVSSRKRFDAGIDDWMADFSARAHVCLTMDLSIRTAKGRRTRLMAAEFASELKADFDVLYQEAATRRRMMSVSTHDRISGIPARVKAIGEFIDYAQKHPGVVFMRKDAIARFALTQADTPREGGI
jgi:hypothetical protein